MYSDNTLNIYDLCGFEIFRPKITSYLSDVIIVAIPIK